MPHPRFLRAALLTAALLVAPLAGAGPVLPCPDGPDPLRFEPERSVPGAACRPANAGDCFFPEPACPGPLDIDAAVDPVTGAEYVALAWLSPSGEAWVAVSGDGGRNFSTESGGMAATLVSAGPSRGRPAVALRVEDGSPWLGIAYEVAEVTTVRLTDSFDGSFGAESRFQGAPYDLSPDFVVSPSPLPAAFVLATADSLVRSAVVASTPAQRDPVAWDLQSLPFGPDVRVVLAADASGTAGGFGLSHAGVEVGGELRLTRSEDGGASWETERLVGPSPLGSFALAIDAAPDASLADSAWSLLAHAWGGAGPRSLRMDASRQAGGTVEHAFDEEAGSGSTELEPAAEAVARPAVAAGPSGLAHVLWAGGGELLVSRQLMSAARPTLGGGCGPSRLTGLDPPRAAGTAAAPAAASLGSDLVVAFVDDRSGAPEVWIKRSDSRPPATPVLVPIPSSCGEIPSIAVTWAAPEPDLVSQLLEVGSAPGGTDFTRDAGLSAALLVEGLTPGTSYYFRLRVADAAGHEVVSEEVTADTPSCVAALLSATILAINDTCPFGGSGGDGVLDPGETATLRVRVENSGTEAAPAVFLRLLSRSPALLVRTGNLDLGDLDVGSAAEADVSVDLSATVSCGERVELLARTTSAGTLWGDLVDLSPPLACSPCASALCSVTADASLTAPLVICDGGSATLDAGATASSDCAGLLLHEWSDAGNPVGTGSTSMVSPRSTKTYRLVSRCSTDLSCQGEDSVEIVVHPLPGITIMESPAPPQCEGDTVTLSASTTDPGASYSWDTGEGTPEIMVTASGLYRVTVTDTNGCVSGRSYRVDLGRLPLADAGPAPDPSRCAPARIGTAALPLLDYSWDPPEGLDDRRSAQPLASPANATTYTLTVTDPLSGCFATSEVRVDVQPAPELVAGLRLSKDPSGLSASWLSPAAPTVRVYSETSAGRARLANASSPTALWSCEGLTSCILAEPVERLVFFQAVSVCADGQSEGPN